MYKKIRIESKVKSIGIIEKAIDEATSELGISADNYGKILVSALEGVNNAILHGNKSDPGKMVDVEIVFRQKELRIKITDQGNGFKPAELPDPTIAENIEAVNGRGVFLMSRLADKIRFSKKGNSVTLVFKNLLL
jgi:serine/threonine-protein kinase RsbW